MKNLALQVGEIDVIEIHEPDSADARCSEIQRHGRSETASADEQDARRFQASLPSLSNLRQQDVTAVAHLFFAAKIRSRVGASLIHGVIYCAEIPRGTTTNSTLTNAATSSNAAERRDE